MITGSVTGQNGSGRSQSRSNANVGGVFIAFFGAVIFAFSRDSRRWDRELERDFRLLARGEVA